MELEPLSIDISTHEAAMEADHEHLRKMCEDLCNHELSIPFQKGTLASRATAPGFQGEGAGRQGEAAS
jgi:hypothetical protein